MAINVRPKKQGAGFGPMAFGPMPSGPMTSGQKALGGAGFGPMALGGAAFSGAVSAPQSAGQANQSSPNTESPMAMNIPQKGGGSNVPLAQQLQGYSAGNVLVPAGDAYDQGNHVYMTQNTSQGRTDETRPVAFTMAPAPTPAASSGGPVDLSSALAAIASQGGMTRDAMGRGFADQMSGIEGQHGQTRGAINQGFADQLSQMLGQFDQSRTAMTGAFDTQGQLIQNQGQQTRDAMGTGFGSQLEGIERLFNQYGSLGGLGGIKTPSAVYRPAGDPNTVNGAQGTNQSIWGATNPFNATF